MAQLDHKTKEPRSLLLFRGEIYLCTHDDSEGKFSQSQMAILCDLPIQEQLYMWQKIKVLVAPPASKYISYDESRSKQSYLDIGFREVSIGVAPQCNQVLRKNMQGKRKQH